jgi:PTH1 family peptidyl-tRNA hydrolase
MRLVVGLGNPGRKYDWTRHNIGFQVVDTLAGAAGAVFTGARGPVATTLLDVDHERTVLAKPQTFMNLSGQAVQALTAFYKLPLAHVLVVCDEVALPLGEIRFRPGGGGGGHNGLQNIIDMLGADGFCRLRIGINNGEHYADLSDYVLGRFPETERERVHAVVDAAAAGVRDWVTLGIEEVMNRYNRRMIG